MALVESEMAVFVDGFLGTVRKSGGDGAVGCGDDVGVDG